MPRVEGFLGLGSAVGRPLTAVGLIGVINTRVNV
jgi:hypothetical protein